MALKVKEIEKRLRELRKLKTSTGETYHPVEISNLLIDLSIIRDDLENTISYLKKNLPVESFPFTGENGIITAEMRGEFEQNIKDIFKAMFDRTISKKEIDIEIVLQAIKMFLKGAKLSKSSYNKKIEEDKKALAVIELNTKKIGEKPVIKVLKNEKLEKDYDYSVSVE